MDPDNQVICGGNHPSKGSLDNDPGVTASGGFATDSLTSLGHGTPEGGGGEQGSTKSKGAEILDCTIETSNTFTITNALAQIPGLDSMLKQGSWARAAVDVAGGGNAVAGLLDAGRVMFGNSANGKQLAQAAVRVMADPSLGLNPLTKVVGLSGQGVPSIAPDMVEAATKGVTSLTGATAEVGEEAATGVGLFKIGIDAVLTGGSAIYCLLKHR